MRDLQRLEELNSTAAIGLWADDVVLALHRSAAGGPEDADTTLLRQAAEVLEDALARTEDPLAPPRSAHGLIAGDTAVTVVSALRRDADEGGEHDVLLKLVGSVRSVADGQTLDASLVDPLVRLFGTLSEVQLRRNNAVLATGQDLVAWTATSQT